MQERITRVIQNHYMSCQNIGKYLYVLRGFDFIKERVSVPKPLIHYNEKHQERDALYIFEEELDNINIQDYNDYEIISVTFNLFDEGLLQKDKSYIAVKPLNFKVDVELNIFNTINPLIGVVSDLELDDAARYIYMNSVL